MIARNEFFEPEEDDVPDAGELADDVARKLAAKLEPEELSVEDSEIIANLADALAALRSMI